MTAVQTAPVGAYDIIHNTVPHIRSEGYAFADPGDIISADYSFRLKVRQGRERCEYFTKDDRTGFRFADLGDKIIFGANCTDEDISHAISAAAFKWQEPLSIEGRGAFTEHIKEIAGSMHMELRQPEQNAEVPEDAALGWSNGPEEIIIKTDRDSAGMFRLFCRILDESPEEALSGMFGDYLRRMAFDAIHTLENILDPVRAREDHERTAAGLKRLKKAGAAELTEPSVVPEAPVSTHLTSPGAAAGSQDDRDKERGQSLTSPMQMKETSGQSASKDPAANPARTTPVTEQGRQTGYEARYMPYSNNREERGMEDSGLGL